MHWLNAILAAIAYRDLALFEPAMRSSEGEWAFLPSDTAPAVVLAISAWLVFRRLGRWRALPDAIGPWWLTGALLGLGAAIYVWATLTSAADLLAPSLMFAGLGYASLFKGTRAVRVMLLPAIFLLFAVLPPAPLLNQIVFRLQIWSAEYAGWILFLLGIPALVEGELVAQAHEAFKVIETCSGFRSVVTLVMLSVVLSDLFRRPPLHSLAMIVVAPFIGFALNGFRVAGLILNPHSSIAEIHHLQGVLILLSGLLVLYAIDGLLARVLGSDVAPESALGVSTPGTAPGAWRRFGPPALLIAAFAISLWLPRWRPWEPPIRVALFSSFEEERVSGWTSSRRDVDHVFLGSTGYAQNLHRRYERGDDSVDLFLAVGDHDDRRERSVFSPKTALPGSGWTILEERAARLGVGGPPVGEFVVRSGKHLRLIYQWYLGTSGLPTEVLRALAAVDDGPFPRATDPVAVRISTPLDGPGHEARIDGEDRLEGFYRDFRAHLEQLEVRLVARRPS